MTEEDLGLGERVGEKSQFLSRPPCKAKFGAASEGGSQAGAPVDRAL